MGFSQVDTVTLTTEISTRILGAAYLLVWKALLSIALCHVGLFGPKNQGRTHMNFELSIVEVFCWRSPDHQ